MSLYVKDGGIFRANPDAQDSNNLKLQVCQPCTETLPCLDYFEGAETATNTMVSVTIDGTAYPLTTTTQVQNVDTWVPEVEAALAQGTNEEINIIVRAAYSGGALSFEHQGRKTISAITTSGGAIALTRECDKSGHADYSISVVGAVGDLNDGTTSSAMTNSPYAYTGTPATDATTAATLKSDLETALAAISASFVSTSVTVNDITGKYDVVIHRQKDGKYLYFGTDSIVESNACMEWNAGALAV